MTDWAFLPTRMVVTVEWTTEGWSCPHCDHFNGRVESQSDYSDREHWAQWVCAACVFQFAGPELQSYVLPFRRVMPDGGDWVNRSRSNWRVIRGPTRVSRFELLFGG